MKNLNAIHKLNITFVSILALSLLACATSLNPAVKEAKHSYQNLQNDAQVKKHASLQLREAGELLDKAKNASSDEEAKHLAYLTERKIKTADASARQGALEDQIRRFHEWRGDRRARMYEKSAIEARQEVRDLQSEISTLQSALSEFETRQTERGFEVTLGDVVFETDSANLKSGAERRLRPIADHLMQNPDRVVQIEGHTDNVGSASYNLQLSDRRANSVKHAMVLMGVPPEQILAKGFGKDQPLTANASPEGRLQNRRVEIIIVPAL
jgi:outer membrane protein OmpA-like peptidoglycan-associated protein